MAKRGFPELLRHWKHFGSLKCEPVQINESDLAPARTKHMNPLFSHPYLGAAVALGAALLGTSHFVAGTFPLLRGLGQTGQAILTALTAFNYTFLLTYAATYLQRHVFYPMERILSLDVASMLSRRNFRAWHENTPATKATSAGLRAVGVNDLWDNPNYKAYYRLKGEQCERLEARTPQEFIQMHLREFLGYKDAAARKFVPGKFTADLKDGKRSVTLFVKEHQAELDQSRAGALPFELGLILLSELLEKFVRPGCAGAKRLRSCLIALEKGDFTGAGSIEAHVWERDPWCDLTHQEEFYSSASLRGVKPLGRGMKGRLGCFGYLRNKSISALDFTSNKGRVVRARIAAAYICDYDKKIPILFVDGVEGSNAINPRLIQPAIEDYARACGFKAVVYNKFVHNQIPRKFVRHVARSGAELRELSIAYADDTTREYLDAFGLPLEPFEYSYPRGKVVGYVVNLDKEKLPGTRAPSLVQNVLHFAKRNALWALLGETLSYTGTIMWYSSPELIAPFGLAAAAGIAIHWWYQFKSVRKR